MSQSNFSLQAFQVSTSSGAISFSANHLLEFNYYEDIEQASIVVTATVTDTGTGRLSEIVGLEPVELKMTDNQGTTLSLSLIIFEIKNRKVDDAKQLSVTLCMCNKDVILNSALKISTRFGSGAGQDISEIVTNLLKKTMKTKIPIAQVDPTQGKFSFISNYWDPYYIIKWLSWRAIPAKGSGKNSSAGYLFFENAKGYNFRSMDNLVAQPVTREIFIKKNYDLGDDKQIVTDTFKVIDSSDIMRGLNLGSYSSTTHTYDVKDRKYTEVPFNVVEFYSSMPKLNSQELPGVLTTALSKLPPTRIMSKVLNTANFTEGTYTQDLTKQLSQSHLRRQFFFNSVAEVEYFGDMNLIVGQIVEIVTRKGKDRSKDTKQSGKYIIGKIHRQFISANDQMRTKVTLYRDSLG